jgi:hypothetical protein
VDAAGAFGHAAERLNAFSLAYLYVVENELPNDASVFAFNGAYTTVR